MWVKDFDFDLPDELIAQKPLSQRDLSRMMVVNRKSGIISHKHFRDLEQFFQPDDVLLLNDSKVFPARVWGKKNGKDIEFLFLKALSQKTWEVMCRPAKHVQPGDTIQFGPDFTGTVLSLEEEGRRIIQFEKTDILTKLQRHGFAPLPPYIKRQKRNKGLRLFDLERYQTVFAQNNGSIAAPTAGLHFTPDILKKFEQHGIKVLTLTLHVGLATFQPVRTERVEDHHMLSETYTIDQKTADYINKAKKASRPITAVGTTSVRSLESATFQGKVRSGRFTTALFIYPGYRFQTVDRLLTNFHLPKSSLLMLTAAFAGDDLIMQAYQEAIKAKYRFFSYGDCMLII